MSKHILKLRNTVNDIVSQTIFFGEYSGFQRYDQYKYPYAKKIEETMRNKFWNPNEISLVDDRVKFEGLPDHVKEILTKNLLFQTLMDSGQNRGVDNVLSEHATLPEWEAAFKTQAYFELIHCLPSDDEILTAQGWKKLADITMDDDVANWNPNYTITYTKPISVQKQEYKGKMYVFEHKIGVKRLKKIMCTPEHRVIMVKNPTDTTPENVVEVKAKNWDKNMGGYFVFYRPNDEKIFIPVSQVEKTVVDWEGEIVGVEVPSTYLLAKIDKVVTVTGNSLSYSHILREVFPDSTKVFNRIEELEEIKQRMNKEVELYNLVASEKFYELSEEQQRKKLLELIVRIYALESVKFYVSFLVTYLINDGYKSAIQGITRIIKLIHADEVLHVALMKSLLNILRTEKNEGFVDLFDNGWFDEMAKSIFEEVAADEIEWGKYLLSHGPIPSLTETVIKDFVQFFKNHALRGIKISAKPVKTDMVSWFLTYSNIDLDNTAAQEAEGTAYNVGILKDDLGSDKLAFNLGA